MRRVAASSSPRRRCRRRRGRARRGSASGLPGRCTRSGVPSTTHRRRWRPSSRSAMASAMAAPAPPSRTPSSAVTTSGWRAASAIMSGSSGLTTRTSHTVALTPSASSSVGGVLGRLDQLADARGCTRRSPSRTRRARQAVADLVSGRRAARRVFGPADARRARRDRQRVVEHHLQLLVRRRARRSSCPGPSRAAPGRARRGATGRRRR